MPVMNYPSLVSNSVWNIIARLTKSISVNDGKKKVYVTCSFSDLTAVRAALNSYKKYVKETTVEQKKTEATVILKTFYEYEARNIAGDLITIQNSGIIVEQKAGVATTNSGEKINSDGTLSDLEIKKDVISETVNNTVGGSKKYIIIGLIIVTIGVVGYIIYKKKFSKK